MPNQDFFAVLGKKGPELLSTSYSHFFWSPLLNDTLGHPERWHIIEGYLKSELLQSWKDFCQNNDPNGDRNLVGCQLNFARISDRAYAVQVAPMPINVASHQSEQFLCQLRKNRKMPDWRTIQTPVYVAARSRQVIYASISHIKKRFNLPHLNFHVSKPQSDQDEDGYALYLCTPKFTIHPST